MKIQIKLWKKILFHPDSVGNRISNDTIGRELPVTLRRFLVPPKQGGMRNLIVYIGSL
jgi:hypothetical protein